MKIRSLALASLFAVQLGRATTITEDFATDPLQHGWKNFGNTNLFHWNVTNQNLEVTWDSSQTNSFFYLPLNTILTTNDDFSLAFDLRLDDVQAVGFGTQIAVSLFKQADATRANFDRVSGAFPDIGPRNIVEYDYFPYAGDETVSPTMISQDDTGYDQWASGFFDPNLMTNGVTFRITLSFTAASQSLATVITCNGGQPWTTFSPVTPGSTFKGFQLDTVAVSCYDGTSDPYDATLAHGVVDNFTITLPPPPVQNFSAAFDKNGLWKCQFLSQSNWVYALERSTNLMNWTAVISGRPGTGDTSVFYDQNIPPDQAFYRVRADRP